MISTLNSVGRVGGTKRMARKTLLLLDWNQTSLGRPLIGTMMMWMVGTQVVYYISLTRDTQSNLTFG